MSQILLFALVCAIVTAKLPQSKQEMKEPTKPDVGFFWDTLKIGSLNIMGMPWLPFRQQAIETLFAEKKAQFDVLHLIEVWDTVDQETIVKLAKKQGYKYSYIPAPTNGPAGCDFSNPTVQQYSQYFIYCLLSQTLPGPINTQNIIQPYPYPMNESCGAVAVGLSLEVASNGQQCFACLVSAMQDLPNDSSAYAALEICGSQQGKKYFMGGQNGQMILSKYPINDVKNSHLEAFLSYRVNIYATINNIRIGFGHFAYNVLADYGPFGPYQYGATQIDHAKDMVAENPDVIIGDFNTGVDYQPEGYDYLLGNGYVDLIQTQPVETWCPADRLDFQLCVNSGSYSASIDHLMIKDDCRLWSRHAKLFANTGNVTSDHVGVAATVSKLWFTNPKMEEKFGC